MKRIFITLVVVILAVSAGVAMKGHSHGEASKRPAESEFGPGPRTSEQGLYIVTLQGAADLKPRRMQRLQFTVADAKGEAVSGATIVVDGGMPEHGHGLPTRPRVTSPLGGGWYEINGLRFNMGGWWELKLTITTAAGTDTVTFNLQL